MPDLSFRIGEVGVMSYAAVPTLLARLHIANAVDAEEIQSISLNVQLQLLPLGRTYSSIEESRLLDLFGEREQWGRTMRPLHWMNLLVKVAPFSAETTLELALPCSVDFDVAANKYFYGLEQGSITVAAYFSGTVFYVGDTGAMQIAQIPWDREARFQIPAEAWKAAIHAHYPDSAWLRLPQETFDRLYRFKVARGIPMWNAVIEQLLNQAESSGTRQEFATTERAR